MIPRRAVTPSGPTEQPWKELLKRMLLRVRYCGMCNPLLLFYITFLICILFSFLFKHMSGCLVHLRAESQAPGWGHDKAAASLCPGSCKSRRRNVCCRGTQWCPKSLGLQSHRWYVLCYQFQLSPLPTRRLTLGTAELLGPVASCRVWVIGDRSCPSVRIAYFNCCMFVFFQWHTRHTRHSLLVLYQTPMCWLETTLATEE